MPASMDKAFWGIHRQDAGKIRLKFQTACYRWHWLSGYFIFQVNVKAKFLYVLVLHQEL